MTKAEKERQAIDRIKAGLKCSDDEAQKVYAYDCAVEAGEKTEHDLPPDKLKTAQKFAHTGTRKTPTIYKFGAKPTRQPNVTKGGIIAELGEFLKSDSDYEVKNLQITNPERQITFQIGDNTFELTLIQKRKPKT